MELTLGSETSAFNTQTPGDNPEDYIIYSQHSESLKSTMSSSSGAELPLNTPLPSILDAGDPIFDLHVTDILFDVILPSVLGSSL